MVNLDLGGNQEYRQNGRIAGAWGLYFQINKWTDSPCVLQDFVPFGAAAQK